MWGLADHLSVAGLEWGQALTVVSTWNLSFYPFFYGNAEPSELASQGCLTI